MNIMVSELSTPIHNRGSVIGLVGWAHTFEYLWKTGLWSIHIHWKWFVIFVIELELVRCWRNLKGQGVLCCRSRQRVWILFLTWWCHIRSYSSLGPAGCQSSFCPAVLGFSSLTLSLSRLSCLVSMSSHMVIHTALKILTIIRHFNLWRTRSSA